MNCGHSIQGALLLLGLGITLTLPIGAQATPARGQDRQQNLRILNRRLNRAAFPAAVVNAALKRAAWAAKGHPYVSDSWMSARGVSFMRSGARVILAPGLAVSAGAEANPHPTNYWVDNGRPVLYLEVGQQQPDPRKGSSGLFLMHTYTKVGKNQTLEHYEVQRSILDPGAQKYFMLDAAGKRVRQLTVDQAAALLDPGSIASTVRRGSAPGPARARSPK